MLTLCVGKSTYARCGIIVNVTPLEPEWEGHVTLEFSNTTNLPAKIYANEGVAQLLFFQSDEPCEVTYKDRGGKYQGQQGVTLSPRPDERPGVVAGTRRGDPCGHPTPTRARPKPVRGDPCGRPTPTRARPKPVGATLAVARRQHGRGRNP